MNDALLLPRPLRVLVLALSHLCSFALIGRAVVDASAADALWLVPLGVVLGHVGVDAVTLLTHWTFDNYFTSTTPVVGKVVFFFRQHHKTPLSMFERDFVDNNFEQSLFCLCWTVPALVVHASPLPAALIGWGTVVGAWITAIHKQTHIAAPHPFFRLAQRLHLVVDAGHHDVHHRGEAKNYGLAAGWLDIVFERLHVLRGLEALIERTTGAAPAHRRWHEAETTTTTTTTTTRATTQRAA